jgi:DNA-binding SARP family transcriptional activator
MSEDRPLPARYLAGLSQYEEPEAVLRGRDASGKLNKPLASVVRVFPAHNENENTWPVRIHTLGMFSLTLKGNAVSLDPEAGQQAFDFLKALIALGGRGVSPGSLAAALWPQADVSAARQLINAALRILRECLGEACVKVSLDGRIGLDSHNVWVDAWDFERTLAVTRRIVNEDSTGADAARLELLSSRLLGLYQGHFLAGENDTSWFVSLRERLRMKFIQHLLDAGQYWECRGLWDKAKTCYQRGLEVDDLVEDFYQRLMVCCRETRNISEGLAVYRHCRKVLSMALGLQPAPETEALQYSLMDAMPGKHTA